VIFFSLWGRCLLFNNLIGSVLHLIAVCIGLIERMFSCMYAVRVDGKNW
jgi:hypothetical protein